MTYGQDGEAIRPEQGYPLRLVVPSYEKNMSIKWLRRLEISDTPFMTREETSKYTDLGCPVLVLGCSQLLRKIRVPCKGTQQAYNASWWLKSALFPVAQRGNRAGNSLGKGGLCQARVLSALLTAV